MPVKFNGAVICATAAAFALSGCASEHDTAAGKNAVVKYDAYYDGYYGPISDGYWGPDRIFYYQLGEGHIYHRDDGQHVRRKAGAGMTHIHGRHNHSPGVSETPPRMDRPGHPAVNPLPLDPPRPNP